MQMPIKVMLLNSNLPLSNVFIGKTAAMMIPTKKIKL